MPTPDQLRSGLEYALQETDPGRELDSLERVTVLAYLTGQGFQPPADDTPHPRTIGGWLEWAAHCSPAS